MNVKLKVVISFSEWDQDPTRIGEEANVVAAEAKEAQTEVGVLEETATPTNVQAGRPTGINETFVSRQIRMSSL